MEIKPRCGLQEALVRSKVGCFLVRESRQESAGQETCGFVTFNNVALAIVGKNSSQFKWAPVGYKCIELQSLMVAGRKAVAVDKL